MLDLQLSLIVMIASCVAAAVSGSVLQSRADRRTVLYVLATVCTVMTAYLVWIWDRPLLSRLIPYSGAIILGNWLPVIGSFFVGVCLQTARIALIRRMLLGITMAALCGYSLMSPLLGDAPRCQPVTFERDLEYQTTDQTCSAACAASLLRLHGIPATERELAELCLTRHGTHWLGVYRGLMLKTAGTEWTVVVEELNPQTLRDGRLPLGIMSLAFDPTDIGGQVDVEYGFSGDVGHSVLSLGCCDTHLPVVFDPSPDFGLERWHSETIQLIKRGVLLRLESRRGTPSPALNLAELERVFWLSPSMARR